MLDTVFASITGAADFLYQFRLINAANDIHIEVACIRLSEKRECSPTRNFPAVAGRMLRAPTAFADAAMVLATTNCSWALTTRMLANLIDRCGRRGAFPSQETVAQASERELREAGWGYRAKYLRDLARGPDLEPLRGDERPTPELRRYLLALPGFGPYAADTMLKQLGRFEHLVLNSWVSRVCKEKFPRRKPTESAIRRHLAHYGEWVGLAFFLIVTANNYTALPPNPASSCQTPYRRPATDHCAG